MKEIIKQILIETRERFAVNAFARDVVVDPQLPKVQVITGPRRSGKSSLLRLMIAQLLDQNIGWQRICYIPLEDERLRSGLLQGETVLEAFRELHPGNALLKDVFFFFDEIQYLPDWEAFINRIHQQISKHVVITGSNSRTLHTELSSVLRGRSLAIELLPLSFREYLRFRQLTFSAYGSQAVLVRAAFHEYLMQGGYPELVGLQQPLQQRILQEYFNTVIYRDILDQTQPASYGYLRYLFHRLAANTGKTTATSKIFNELKSQGYSVSKNSLYQMVDFAEAVYLYKRISRFDPSLIKRENSEKKGYFIDNGMLNAIDMSFTSNQGALLENLVFYQLYRLYGNIYTTDIFFYKDPSQECDFILYREGGRALPIQVCWKTDQEQTREREIKGLLKACNQLGSSIGLIITLENEEELEVNGKKIIILPAWKWFAEQTDLRSM